METRSTITRSQEKGKEDRIGMKRNEEEEVNKLSCS